MHAPGDTHGTLNLVRKSVEAAKVQGLQQDGFCGLAITLTSQYASSARRTVDSANAIIATNSVSAGSVTPSKCGGIASVRAIWRRLATS